MAYTRKKKDGNTVLPEIAPDDQILKEVLSDLREIKKLLKKKANSKWELSKLIP